MPSYDFKCEACGAIFERHFHLEEEKSGGSCPECSSRNVRRLYSAPAIEFKGQGFYATDGRTGSPATNTTGSTS